jgi:hypothetical protein
MTQNTALVAGVSLCTPLFNLMIALGDILVLVEVPTFLDSLDAETMNWAAM